MSNERSHSTLVLASSSPRRKELLERLSLRFEVERADIDETPRPGESPKGYVKRLAREKANTVAKRIARTDALVLAADTSVVLGKEILGKPTDKANAVEMLKKLSGKTHEVLTAVAVAGTHHDTVVVETAVTFKETAEDALRWYADTGEPMDKAGAYAIQGIGAFLVARIDGSPTNVIGLPVPETLQLLEKGGVLAPWRKT